MSEKLDTLFNELKDKHYISLYQERVMTVKNGEGEITFYFLKDGENDNTLILYNDSCSISFTSYNFITENENEFLNLLYNDNVIAKIAFPSKQRIIDNHNTFYVEEFAVRMENLMKANSSKGDWADKSYIDQMTALMSNLDKIKAGYDKEKVKKSCVDIANYACMIFYGYGSNQ